MKVRGKGEEKANKENLGREILEDDGKIRDRIKERKKSGRERKWEKSERLGERRREKKEEIR